MAAIRVLHKSARWVANQWLEATLIANLCMANVRRGRGPSSTANLPNQTSQHTSKITARPSLRPNLCPTLPASQSAVPKHQVAHLIQPRSCANWDAALRIPLSCTAADLMDWQRQPDSADPSAELFLRDGRPAGKILSVCVSSMSLATAGILPCLRLPSPSAS